MAIYMKIPNIEGNVTTKGHENWIHLKSFIFDVSKQVSSNVGSTKNRVNGKTKVGEIEIIKNADSSSIALFTNALKTQQAIAEIIIDVCATADELTTYANYKLKNVIVSSFTESYDEIDNHIKEFINLNFTGIEKSFTAQYANGMQHSPMKVGYDLSQGVTT